MKTRGWLLAIALLTLIICLIWWRTSLTTASRSNMKPTLSLAALSITDIDDERIKLNSRIVVKNPLPMEFTTDRLDYEIFVNDKKILESAYLKPIRIESGDSTIVEIPMEVLVEPLTTLLKQLEKTGADSADYLLKTTINVDVPIKGETQFDIDISKRLPSFRLPKVHPEDIDINKLAWKESKIRLIMIVDNPNLFPLKMKDVAYDLKLGNDIALHGEQPGITNIPAKSSVRIPVYLEIANPEMLKLVGKTLIGKGDTKFNLDFSCDIVSRNELFRESKIAMHTDGTLKKIRNAIKANKGQV